jgi:hypothetical protein
LRKPSSQCCLLFWSLFWTSTFPLSAISHLIISAALNPSFSALH